MYSVTCKPSTCMARIQPPFSFSGCARAVRPFPITTCRHAYKRSLKALQAHLFAPQIRAASGSQRHRLFGQDDEHRPL